MTPQQQLRELANKLLPERMKLEFGCEVEYMGRKYLFVEDDPIFEHRLRSEEHTSELQSHSFISYAVFCLKKKNKK